MVASALGEDLSEFARKAVRQRVQAVQAKHGSPWDEPVGECPCRSASGDKPERAQGNALQASMICFLASDDKGGIAHSSSGQFGLRTSDFGFEPDRTEPEYGEYGLQIP
jgi:hypothetical protein